jgi:lysophospholipase L1-like esterase
LQYELDGNYIKRIQITSGSIQPTRIATGAGRHQLKIFKATEATTGPIFIHAIEAENIVADTLPEKPLIEFIGNSITCAAASDTTEVPCGKGVYHDQHNAYRAYGPRVAAALNVNFILSCVSGIGIYRNWNSDGPPIGAVYEKLSLTDTDNRNYPFQKNIPDIVSIALGTNDFNKGDGIKTRLPFDSTRFINNYIDFIRKVKTTYPTAKIALLTSPVIGIENSILLQRYLAIIKKAIDELYPEHFPVSIYKTTLFNATGCTGHPGVEDHARMANELIPFFRQLIKSDL